jgi:hypothetical protein
MMNLKLYGITAAVMFALAGAAQAQSTTPSTPRADPADRGSVKGTATDRKLKSAEDERIEAEYKADKAKCDAMKGNAKDVCEKEAKGKEKVAKAELDARANPSERNQRKVDEAKAEARYEVAKERCDDMKGKEKNACEKEAKAEHDRAKAAMSKRNASTGSSSTAARSNAGTPK